MVRDIVRDESFLRQPSEPVVRGEEQLGMDLQDTLRANATHCVGLAANMIGRRKRVIIVNPFGLPFGIVMYNPVIIRKEGPYMAEEGCLSLEGTRKALRYENIDVSYQDESWKLQTRTFTGFTAQIIQHEVDHLSGILI